MAAPTRTRKPHEDANIMLSVMQFQSYAWPRVNWEKTRATFARYQSWRKAGLPHKDAMYETLYG